MPHLDNLIVGFGAEEFRTQLSLGSLIFFIILFVRQYLMRMEFGDNSSQQKY